MIDYVMNKINDSKNQDENISIRSYTSFEKEEDDDEEGEEEEEEKEEE